MQHLLVAIDFEPQAQRLIDQARTLASALQAKLWLVHVAAPNPDFVGYEAGPQVVRDIRADELKEEHKQLQRWADDLIQTGVEAEGLLIQGPTAQTLLDESESLGADLIVVGAHERGWLYQALMGRTSDALLQGSTIPVMIVPLG
jgi:nucleotide-binding universal stress UspA family protein